MSPASDKFPVLVVLNPNAGRKEGRMQYDQVVKPCLDSFGSPSRLIETTSPGYAQSYFKDNIQQILIELCQSLAEASNDSGVDNNVAAPSAILSAALIAVTLRIMVIGGDGTVHEIINGILQGLPSAFISGPVGPKIEFSIVPLGTGNAIATSLGIDTVPSAINRFTDGTPTPLRLIKVSTRSNDNSYPGSDQTNLSDWKDLVYTAVVNSFGLHCATVHESESYRILGNTRFKMAALKNILFLKQYKARIDFFGPVQRYDRTLRELVTVGNDPVEEHSSTANPSLTLSGPFTYLMFSKQASLEPGFKPTPLASTSDDWMDVLAVQNVGRSQILRVLDGATKDGQHMDHESVDYFKTKIIELETPSRGRLCVDGEFLDIEAGPQGRIRFEVGQHPSLQLFYVRS